MGRKYVDRWRAALRRKQHRARRAALAAACHAIMLRPRRARLFGAKVAAIRARKEAEAAEKRSVALKEGVAKPGFT